MITGAHFCLCAFCLPGKHHSNKLRKQQTVSVGARQLRPHRNRPLPVWVRGRCPPRAAQWHHAVIPTAGRVRGLRGTGPVPERLRGNQRKITPVRNKFRFNGALVFFSAPPSSPGSQQDVKPPVKYDHVAFIDLTQYLFDKDPSSQTDGRCKERYVSLLIWGDRRLHFLSAVNRDVCDIIFVTRVLSGCYYD